MTGRHTRPTPPGVKWTEYVPWWLKVGVPILGTVVTILVGIFGFGLGLGEGRGTVNTRVDKNEKQLLKLEEYRENDRAVVNDVKVHLTVMNANVTAIALRLGVPVITLPESKFTQQTFTPSATPPNPTLDTLTPDTLTPDTTP